MGIRLITAPSTGRRMPVRFQNLGNYAWRFQSHDGKDPFRRVSLILEWEIFVQGLVECGRPGLAPARLPSFSPFAVWR